MPTNEQLFSLYEVRPQDYDDMSVTPIDMHSAAGAKKTLTLTFPAAPLYFGYRPTTAFSYNGLTQQGVLNLYKYPRGLVCSDLPTSIYLCNNMLEAMNAHAADLAMHKLADTVNFPVNVAPSTNLASLLVKVNLLQIAYAAHNVDAIAGSPTYHIAQDTTHALADATPVTTLAGAITKLNDMLTKYNLHDKELTAHTKGYLHQAFKVLLASINLEDAAALNQQYMVKVVNVPSLGTYQAHAKQPVANCNPADQLVVELVAEALGGGYIAGSFQPVLYVQYRGEGFVNQPTWNDRTPVSTGISSAQ